MHEYAQRFAENGIDLDILTDPLQKVSAMKLLLTAETVPEFDGPDYSFRLGVRYRNKAGVFDSSGACSLSGMTADGDNEVRLSCNVDCDVATSMSGWPKTAKQP